MANRTTDAKAVRCKATEGAQQCLKEQHPKVQNHTWGKRGETAQWNADGTPKSPVRAEAVHPVWGEALQPKADPAADTLVEELPADPHDDLIEQDRKLAMGGNQQAIDRLAMIDADPHVPDPAQARDLEAMEQARQEVRDRLAGEPWPDAFNGDNELDIPQREERREDVADRRRAEIAGAVTDDDVREMEEIRRRRTDAILPPGADGQPRRIDAAQVREEVIRGALSTTLRPQADVSAHVHSSEATQVLELAGVVGDMWAANGNGALVDVDDIRKANTLVRKMAATRGLDLLAEEVGR